MVHRSLVHPSAFAAIVPVLRGGGVGILPTDTIYGIVGSALSAPAVRRIYRLRKRSPKKPFIILVSSVRDLKKHFGIALSPLDYSLLAQLWPGPVSVVLPCRKKKFAYLHRGAQTLAFRMPGDRSLRGLLAKTGPLAAPSANPEGRPPARTAGEAFGYFGNAVDFYTDGGRQAGKSSTLVSFANGKPVVLRHGSGDRRLAALRRE
jgi:L-threonylcarbamoyladenylate synthase